MTKLAQGIEQLARATADLARCIAGQSTGPPLYLVIVSFRCFSSLAAVS